MEELLNYNWNVYKLFKNGKRAKAPFHVFEYDDPVTVGEYFDAKIKENFTEKIRRARLLVLRSDLPQNRKAELTEEKQKILEKKKARVFRKYLQALDSSLLSTNHVCGGLIYCDESNWQWQWAALEMGTGRYLAGLSPTFSCYDAAKTWMQEEIETL
jgi:hypothetical protein